MAEQNRSALRTCARNCVGTVGTVVETVVETVANYIETVSFCLKGVKFVNPNKNVTVPIVFATVSRAVSRTVPTVPTTVPRRGVLITFTYAYA